MQMRELLIARLAEMTADAADRNKPGLFRKTGADEEAEALWLQYASGGMDGHAQEEALRLHGMRREDLSARLRSVEAVADEETLLAEPAFAWIPPLLQCLRLYAGMDPDQLDHEELLHRTSDETERLLMKMLYPFAAFMRRMMTDECGLCAETAASAALYGFRSICPILTDVLNVSVRAFFNAEELGIAALASRCENAKACLRWLYDDGICDLVEHYPVAFRLTMETMERIRRNVDTFLSRVRGDLPALRETFGLSGEASEPEEIQFGLSDHHNGNQSVLIFRMSGCRMVYKPRSMAIDAAWNSMLLKMQEACPGFRLRPLTVLNKGEYGYVSYVQREECASPEAYYRNAGFLLCIASLFGATDLHYENLIAACDSPVIIDLETIISPRPLSRFALLEADKQTSHIINVGRTLLLSKWVGATQEGAREIGGLVSTHASGRNSPFQGSRTFSADQFSASLISGFCDLYRWILDHRNQVSSMISQSGFDGCRVRYVFRRTALYAKMYRHFLHARFMKRAALYEGVTSRMGAGLVVSFTKENADWLWPLVEAEEKAIRRGDIPYFWCEGDTKDIASADGTLVRDFFESTPLALVMDNLARMSENRLQYELSYIRKSLRLSACQPQEAAMTPLVSYQDIIRKRIPPHAETIPLEIERLYALIDEYRFDDLEFSYFAPVRDVNTTRYNLMLLDQTLYSGIWGIMLFHAAYAVWKGDNVLQEKLMQKISALAQPFLTGEDESCFLRIGLAEGIAGVCQALRCLSAILNQPELRQTAVQIMLRAFAYLPRSRQTDYFGGLAGYLYIACRLYAETGREELRPVIEQSADRLMRTCGRNPADGRIVWKTDHEYYPLTGLAHGQAGYAMALAAADRILHREELRAAVDDLLLYERRQYNAAQNNWYDYRRFLVARRDQAPGGAYHERFMYGNCSGAPGMGISRLALMRDADAEQEEVTVRRVVKFCTEYRLVGCDTLCCGTAGWIDFLIEASRRLHEPELLEDACAIATSISPSASGTNWILSNLKGIYDVSLFTGISGLGYELIRTRLPGVIPSPLI